MLQNKWKTHNRILTFVTEYRSSLPNLTNIPMAKWHLIKIQPVLRQIFKDPPVLSYRKGRSLEDILFRAKIWRSMITPMGQWESCLACLFYAPTNNVIFFWGTAEHSPSSFIGSNCDEKARLPIQAWFLSPSRKWSPKNIFARGRLLMVQLLVLTVTTVIKKWNRYHSILKKSL